MFIIKKIVFCIILIFGFTVTTFAADHLITFVCTGSTGRSPMATAFANKYIKNHHLDIAVQSRGLEIDPTELTLEEGTIEVLTEQGIDVPEHEAISLVEQDILASEYLFTMTQEHKKKILAKYPQAANKVFTLAESATGNNQDILDPYRHTLKTYRRLAQQLDTFLPLVLNKIVAE